MWLLPWAAQVAVLLTLANIVLAQHEDRRRAADGNGWLDYWADGDCAAIRGPITLDELLDELLDSTGDGGPISDLLLQCEDKLGDRMPRLVKVVRTKVGKKQSAALRAAKKASPRNW